MTKVYRALVVLAMVVLMALALKTVIWLVELALPGPPPQSDMNPTPNYISGPEVCLFFITILATPLVTIAPMLICALTRRWIWLTMIIVAWVVSLFGNDHVYYRMINDVLLHYGSLGLALREIAIAHPIASQMIPQTVPPLVVLVFAWINLRAELAAEREHLRRLVGS